MTVETIIEDDRWDDVGLETLAETAARAALAHLGLDPDRCEVALLGCDDARIAVLNAQFRGKPTPTNVLSWPAADLAPERPGAGPARPDLPADGPPLELGDIAIAYDTCAAEARAAGKTLPDHATHLIVHGLLHLLGYDHIRVSDATLMERCEADILGKLGLDNPYWPGDG